jgi:beta-lactamase class A
MTIGELCAAAMIYSDNTAANLLLHELGGPHGVTEYACTLGDGVTQLDRIEPALNSAIPGDPRDTTSPAATAADMRRILLGSALAPRSRARLQRWMEQCKTGLTLIRAGIPRPWRAGDKTGLGGSHNALGAANTRNDIAIVFPRNAPPVVVTAYLTGAAVSAKRRDGALSDVGRLLGELAVEI